MEDGQGREQNFQREPIEKAKQKSTKISKRTTENLVRFSLCILFCLILYVDTVKAGTHPKKAPQNTKNTKNTKNTGDSNLQTPQLTSASFNNPFRPSGYVAASGTISNGKIYYYGGLQPPPTVSSDFFSLDCTVKFNALSPPWTLYNNSNNGVSLRNAFHAAVASQTKMYVFGGLQQRDDNNVLSNDSILWNYNIATNNWSISGDQNSIAAPVKWSETSAVLTQGGKLWVFGGLWDRNSGVDSETGLLKKTQGPPTFGSGLFEFDTVVGRWVNFTLGPGSQPGARASHTASLLSDGRMVILGGRTSQALIPMSEIWVYDTNGGSWKFFNVSGQSPQTRAAHSAVVTFDDRIIIYGGANDYGLTQPLGDVAVLDTKNWIWSFPNVTGTPRLRHNAHWVSNQMIITFGNSASLNKSIEILDTNAWKFVSSFDPNNYPTDKSASQAPANKKTTQINVGAVVGGVLSAFAVVCALVGIGLFVCRNRRKIEDVEYIVAQKKKSFLPTLDFGRRSLMTIRASTVSYQNGGDKLLTSSLRPPEKVASQMPLKSHYKKGEKY